MKVICVDDERLVLNQIVKLVKGIKEIESVEGFTKVSEALKYLETESCDVVFLDIDMPEMSGLELAEKIRHEHVTTKIVFVTGYSEYAVEAFKTRASGYLLKPVTVSQLEEEIQYIKQSSPSGGANIFVQTFGNFDIFVGGKAVKFERSKSKEILAFLINKQGTGVTRAELAAVLWEDGDYNLSQQKQLDVYIRSLRNTLKGVGAERILEMNKGVLRVVPEQFICDFYEFLKGNIDFVNKYCGSFLDAYSWAEPLCGMLSQTKYGI